MNENHKKTISKLIDLYCKKKHKTRNGLCNECDALVKYAHLRLEKCLYGNNKPECKHCPVHCYKPQMREQIKDVMRYVGPRLLFYRPIMFAEYLINKIGKSTQVPLPAKMQKKTKIES